MSADVLSLHRSFYEAIETGDVDLLSAMWIDRPDTACSFPGTVPVRGTDDILRSWTVVMASMGYLQFFLTDVEVAYLADGAVAVVTCTENMLSDHGLHTTESFVGARATSTSVFVLSRGRWFLHTHHAAPLFSDHEDDDEERD